jgi:hypothetical protein
MFFHEKPLVFKTAGTPSPHPCPLLKKRDQNFDVANLGKTEKSRRKRRDLILKF